MNYLKTSDIGNLLGKELNTNNKLKTLLLNLAKERSSVLNKLIELNKQAEELDKQISSIDFNQIKVRINSTGNCKKCGRWEEKCICLNCKNKCQYYSNCECGGWID